MSTEETKAIAMEVVSMLKQEGLIVVPASMMDEELQKRKAVSKLLRQKKLTPYQIAKFELLPGVKSVDTIKNMVKDGRIGVNEHYKHEGKMYIMPSAIKRMRDE